ncbi:MAG: Mov34/MPN/PAD-1 family protein [Erythrobacter sp.]
MDIVLTSEVHAALLAAARAAHPYEACGILLGEGVRIREARPARNVHPRPHTHFEIDPQALVDAHRAARAPGALQVLGYYHSHPRGPAAPSAADRAAASGDGRIWAIIAGDDLRMWRDGDAGFAALSFALCES